MLPWPGATKAGAGGNHSPKIESGLSGRLCAPPALLYAVTGALGGRVPEPGACVVVSSSQRRPQLPGAAYRQRLSLLF